MQTGAKEPSRLNHKHTSLTLTSSCFLKYDAVVPANRWTEDDIANSEYAIPEPDTKKLALDQT